MKRYISFLLFLSLLLPLVSCGRDGRDGLDGRDGFGVVKAVLVNVDSQHWQYTDVDNNNCFFATVQVPEITKQVMRTGLVKVYRVYEYNTSGEYQRELPTVDPIEFQFENLEWGNYFEEVDCDICEGQAIFYFHMSDFDYELDESFWPEAMKFRIVVIY